LATTDIGTTGILVGVAVLSLLEDSVGLGAILPAETVVVAAGAAAAHDLVPLWAVFVTAWVFGATGDMIGFTIGRRWGRELIAKYGGKVGLTPARLRQADDVVEEWGAAAVAGGRLIPAVRVVVVPTAGASTMPWKTFVLADIAGAGVWAALHTGLGYLAGVGLQYVNDTSMVLGVALLVLLGAGGAWWWTRRKHNDATPEPEP
jgi:undecaprenyl-diphosphatase